MREREREKKKERGREKEREGKKERERERERKKEKEREKKGKRERETENPINSWIDIEWVRKWKKREIVNLKVPEVSDVIKYEKIRRYLLQYV